MLSQEEYEKTIAWSKVVAGCVIRNEEGKYLLVQESRPKVYGLWNLPAGHVDKGETIEEAAIREAREETGLEVELVRKLGIWHETTDTPVRHAFEAKVSGGELRPQEGEVLDVRYFSYEEIGAMLKEEKLRVSWIYEAITMVENS